MTGRYHIETSPFIYGANQWTGFYMTTASIMKELKNNSIVEKVPLSEIHNFDKVGNIHYLPHRLVIKDDCVTFKVCSVFDASSKIEGPTLNDCLNPGSLLTEPLLSVILCFHANKIVFIVHIEKAFLQV